MINMKASLRFMHFQTDLGNLLFADTLRCMSTAVLHLFPHVYKGKQTLRFLVCFLD